MFDGFDELHVFTSPDDMPGSMVYVHPEPTTPLPKLGHVIDRSYCRDWAKRLNAWQRELDEKERGLPAAC